MIENESWPREKIEQLSSEMKRLFSETTIEGVWDRGEGNLALEVITSTHNGMDIVEAMSDMVLRIFDEEGYNERKEDHHHKTHRDEESGGEDRCLDSL